MSRSIITTANVLLSSQFATDAKQATEPVGIGPVFSSAARGYRQA
jgi:hypothetical protein